MGLPRTRRCSCSVINWWGTEKQLLSLLTLRLAQFRPARASSHRA